MMVSCSPLVSLIKFKCLSSQLTDREFDTFMSKFRTKVGREEILRLLCLPLKQRWAKEDNVDHELTPLSNIVSCIIRNRESTTNHCKQLNLTHLPSAMIGEIASYLSQQHYASFSTTNRKTYSPCTSISSN